MKQIRILIILLTIVTSLFGQTNGYVLKNARWQQEYIEVRQRGKAIIMDN